MQLFSRKQAGSSKTGRFSLCRQVLCALTFTGCSLLAGSTGLAMLSTSAVAAQGREAASVLQSKVAGFTAFSASFVQKVTDKDGQPLFESSGTLALQRPAKFMMHTQQPDEQFLFTETDGVYYYDPVVSQVSIMPLSRLNDSPFALLLQADNTKVWQQYSISSTDKNTFELTPLKVHDISSIKLVFDGSALAQVTAVMADGNVNVYELSAQRFAADSSAFECNIDPDAAVDDMR